jgi:hypothetical protein
MEAWLTAAIELVAWILPVPLGIRAAHRKGISARLMWWALATPFGAWAAYISLASRPACPSCGSYDNYRAPDSEAASVTRGAVAFRPPRHCRKCANLWEPGAGALLLALGVVVGFVIAIFGASLAWSSLHGANVPVFGSGGLGPVVGLFIMVLGGGLMHGSVIRLRRQDKKGGPTTHEQAT